MQNKIKLIALVGQSGSGKTYLANKWSQERGYHLVVSSTTRPPRDNESNEYHFITEQEFKQSTFIEKANFNGWHYGTRWEDLNKEKINIGAFNPEGVYALWKLQDRIDLQIIYVRAADKIRLLRQLNREENPDVSEIVRRYHSDKWDFSLLDEWIEVIVGRDNIEYFDNNGQIA